MSELTRRDRRQAVARLHELAGEIAQISRWLDRFGDDADKAAVLLECAARDLRAACWVIRPADHTRPEGWLDGSRAMRGCPQQPVQEAGRRAGHPLPAAARPPGPGRLSAGLKKPARDRPACSSPVLVRLICPGQQGGGGSAVRWRGQSSSASIPVDLAAMGHIKDQDHESVIVNLVQHAPGTSPHAPRARITYELSGLSGPGILREPVDNPADLPPDTEV